MVERAGASNWTITEDVIESGLFRGVGTTLLTINMCKWDTIVELKLNIRYSKFW